MANDTHPEISGKASLLLVLFCTHTSEFQGFIDAYWLATVAELRRNGTLFLQNLSMIVDGLPSPCLLHLLDVVMTQTPPALYAKTVPAFFAILRALNAREDLTEQQVKEVLPFFFSVSRHLPSSASLVASDWTQEFQTQLEDMVCLCVQRVRDKTALLQQSLNAVVNNTNPRIHLLLIHAILVSLEQAVDYDFSDLFVALLQHVLALLRSAATVAPSSSIQSMLSVMGDCLARMSFMPQNKELVALWTALWTTADATLAALLVDFFDKNLPLLDHSLYSSFLTAALLEPSFVRVALEVWLNASASWTYGCACAVSGRR